MFTCTLATAVLLLAAMLRPWAGGEAAEFRVYALSWALGVPAAAWVSWWAARGSRHAEYGATGAADAGRALGWMAFLCAALLALKSAGAGAASPGWLLAAAAAPAAGYLALRAAARPAGPSAGRTSPPRAAVWLGFGFVPLFMTLAWLPFLPLPLARFDSMADAAFAVPASGPAPGHGTFFAALALTAAVAAVAGLARPGRPALRLSAGRSPLWGPLASVAVCALVAAATADMTSPVNRHHQNWFLGPANDLLRGKALMVDTQCVYGIGPPYLFAMAASTGVAAATSEGVHSVVWAGIAVQACLLYFLMVRLAGSRWVAACGVVSILAVSVFGPVERPGCYPSTGPVRFGPPMLLAGLLAARYPAGSVGVGGGRRRRRWLGAAEATAYGLCVVWSIEALVFGTVAFAAALVSGGAPAWARARFFPGARRILAARAAWRVARGVAAGLVLFALFVTDTWRRSGRLPDVGQYIRMTDGLAGVSALPVHPWDPWALVVLPLAAMGGLFLTQLFAPRVFRRCPTLAPVAPALVCFGALGAAQFVYYIGRSYHGNLFHVSVLPLVIVTVAGGRLAAGAATEARYAGRMLVIGCAVFGVLANSGEMREHQRDSVLGRTLNATGLFGPMWPARPSRPPEPVIEAAVALASRHAPASRRILVAVHTEAVTEVHLRTATASPFPVATPNQTDGIPMLARAVLAAPMPLKPGDVIVALENYREEDMTKFQRDLLAWIAREFTMEVIEREPAGVVAIRLGRRR